MQPFAFVRVDTPAAALQAAEVQADSALSAPTQFLAGGTTLLDLMKLDVMRPTKLIDINTLSNSTLGTIEIKDDGLWLGGLVHMAEAADHPHIKSDYPVIAQSLQLAASQQLRNMASLAGNVLQRTRCPYFRDTSYDQCNKRNPGSGCAARDGINRGHAVLGVSDQCIATYPGDFAQALIALDANVELDGPRGKRTIPFADLHRPPADRPDVETSLVPGEMIYAFAVPAGAWTRRSTYVKVRDRQSYEFALASAAVALDGDRSRVKDIRIALGGVATVPWRARESEAALRGKPLDDAAIDHAADLAFAGSRSLEHNAFKVELGKRTLKRAIRQVMEG